MVSVSSKSTATPASTTLVTPAVKAANKTLAMLIQSKDMTQALSSQSSKYLPATTKQVLSTLWAMFDTKSGKATTISKQDVQAAVLAEGGKPSDASALWAQMDPTGKPTMNAADFAFNKYLTQQIPAQLTTLQTAIAKIQQQQGPASGSTVLDGFITVGGSGSIISNIGNGSASVNIFV